MTSKLSRTRVTNGKALFLDGVDGRTLAARRYRDLFYSFISDLGGTEFTPTLKNTRDAFLIPSIPPLSRSSPPRDPRSGTDARNDP